MRLRTRFILYLVAIHFVFAVTAFFVLVQNRAWLLAIELFFILSLVAGIRLTRSLFKPLELSVAGSELIAEGEFTTTFRPTGQPEMDRLVELYNQMVKRLRQERLRLEEQHLFLHKLLDASPAGVVILDYDGRIQLINPSAERLLGRPAKAVAGRALGDLGTPFSHALANLPVDASAVVPFRGNRRMKCTRSSFMDQGFQRHFILVEELTEEIRRSEKSAYEKLIRLLSHEVNNSVGAVNSLLQSCLFYRDQIRDGDRPDFETAVNVSISRLGNLNRFMKSYADIVRLPPPALKECRMAELVRTCAELFRRESEEKGIAWRWEVDESLPPVAVDPGQMEQVFLNIFKNAIEAIGAGGTITVRIGRRRGKSHVVVEDSGEGISDDAQQNLFAPFFSTKDNGQGIGLTVVQEILTRHRFDFSLESPPGGPTRFVIRF